MVSKYLEEKKINFDLYSKNIYIGSSYNDRINYHDYSHECCYDIVFIGGITKNHENRIETLNELSKTYTSFAFYGYVEHGLTLPSYLSKSFMGWADTIKTRQLYSSCKIALNLPLDNYEDFENGFNQRLFEIPPCKGALQLSVYNKNIFKYFRNNEEIITFKNNNELVANITNYLKEYDLIIYIKKKSYQRSLEYSYQKIQKSLIS